MKLRKTRGTHASNLWRIHSRSCKAAVMQGNPPSRPYANAPLLPHTLRMNTYNAYVEEPTHCPTHKRLLASCWHAHNRSTHTTACRFYKILHAEPKSWEMDMQLQPYMRCCWLSTCSQTGSWFWTCKGNMRALQTNRVQCNVGFDYSSGARIDLAVGCGCCTAARMQPLQ